MNDMIAELMKSDEFWAAIREELKSRLSLGMEKSYSTEIANDGVGTYLTTEYSTLKVYLDGELVTESYSW